MIPYMQKGDLTALHGRRRNAICGCKKQCRVFYTFINEDQDTDFILCAEDAKAFAFEILDSLGLLQNHQYVKGVWSVDDEHLIKRYIKENKPYDERGHLQKGTIRELSEILGKTYKQVKGKIYTMRRAGKL